MATLEAIPYRSYTAATASTVYDQLVRLGGVLTEHDTVHDGWSDILSLCAEAWARYHVAVQQCAVRSADPVFQAEARSLLRDQLGSIDPAHESGALWVLDGVVPLHPQQRLVALVLAGYAVGPSTGIDGLRRGDRNVMQHQVRLLLHTPQWFATLVRTAVADTGANGWVGVASRCSAVCALDDDAAVEYAAGVWRPDDTNIDAAVARASRIGCKLAVRRRAATTATA